MSDRLPDARLDELDALTAALLPAPWVSLVEGRDFHSGSSFVLLHDAMGEQVDLYLSLDPQQRERVVALQDWMAAARNDISALIAELRALRRAGAAPPATS